MSRKLTALALSALVLPGLGQLYLGKKIKGGIILALVNIFILAALAILARGLGKLIILAKAGADVSTPVIMQTIQENAPGARWLIILFCALWVYGIVDLLSTKDRPVPDAQE
jgi:TM2 domain-containing membrane protein YozV